MPTKAESHSQRLAATRPRRDDRPSAARRGYDQLWRTVRKQFLRAHPMCQLCLCRDHVVGATEVDHITPLRQGGDRLAWSNLQALCRRCHSRKTATEDGGFGNG